MFKAIDTTTGESIVILEVAAGGGLSGLRVKARIDQLRCPVCHQPVWAKAGVPNQKRPHFAHKHLGDCPSSHDSPELLQGRAVLYDWLKSKFAEGAKIEERPPGWELARPLDAWVSHAGRCFAYWLLDRRMHREDREQLKAAVEGAGATLNTVFLAQAMRRNNAPQGVLSLTTTERAFLQPSDYDAIYASRRGLSEGSLHYLDAQAGTITTFRGMCCTESPQQFSGHEMPAALRSLLVSPVTGEFVHPGEREELQRYCTAQRRAAEAKAREEAGIRAEALARKRRQVEAEARAVAESLPVVFSGDGPRLSSERSADDAERTIAGGVVELTCLLCKQKVRAWYWRHGSMCKCLECHAAGRRR